VNKCPAGIKVKVSEAEAGRGGGGWERGRSGREDEQGACAGLPGSREEGQAVAEEGRTGL